MTVTLPRLSEESEQPNGQAASSPPAPLSSQGAPPAAKAASGGGAQQHFAGTWGVASGGQLYTIFVDDGAQLQFRQTSPDGVECQCLLHFNGSWCHGAPASADGKVLGSIRFSVGEDPCTLVSNFRRAGDIHWGAPLIAHPLAEPSVPTGSTAHAAAVAPKQGRRLTDVLHQYRAPNLMKVADTCGTNQAPHTSSQLAAGALGALSGSCIETLQPVQQDHLPEVEAHSVRASLGQSLCTRGTGFGSAEAAFYARSEATLVAESGRFCTLAPFREAVHVQLGGAFISTSGPRPIELGFCTAAVTGWPTEEATLQSQGADPALPPGIPTLGTVGHANGDCKPCFYIHTKVGCQYGAACMFCHGGHPKRKQERPQKFQREAFRLVVDRIFEEHVLVGASHEEANAALLRCDEFPHGDHVAMKYARKLLRSLYRDAGLETMETLSSGHSPSRHEDAETLSADGA